MGSSEALLYFDKNGMVVARCAHHRTHGLELTAPFKEVVQELGGQLNMAFELSSSML